MIENKIWTEKWPSSDLIYKVEIKLLKHLGWQNSLESMKLFDIFFSFICPYMTKI